MVKWRTIGDQPRHCIFSHMRPTVSDDDVDAELSMGWVDPRDVLGWVGSGMG